MNGWSGDFEEVSKVRFRRWPTIEFGVGVDKSQVLTLSLSERRVSFG
jgi:hypothetical protein